MACKRDFPLHTTIYRNMHHCFCRQWFGLIKFYKIHYGRVCIGPLDNIYNETGFVSTKGI